jgi:hypothetical protein
MSLLDYLERPKCKLPIRSVAATWMPITPVIVARARSGLLNDASRHAERYSDQEQYGDVAHGEAPFCSCNRVSVTPL